MTEDANLEGMGQVRVERATAGHAARVTALFERVGCPCFCRYWDFAGDGKQWQDRCANAPDANRRELSEALAAVPPVDVPPPSEDAGLLALVALDESGDCVGWMRLERPARMDKAYQGRLYRGLPCFAGPRDGVLTVACFLVDESWRGRGVAARLLTKGIELARSLRAQAIEALPRRAENVSPEQHWMGPPDLFARHGFAVVHEFEPYPVFRLEL